VDGCRVFNNSTNILWMAPVYSTTVQTFCGWLPCIRQEYKHFVDGSRVFNKSTNILWMAPVYSTTVQTFSI